MLSRPYFLNLLLYCLSVYFFRKNWWWLIYYLRLRVLSVVNYTTRLLFLVKERKKYCSRFVALAQAPMFSIFIFTAWFLYLCFFFSWNAWRDAGHNAREWKRCDFDNLLTDPVHILNLKSCMETFNYLFYVFFEIASTMGRCF